MSRFSYLPLLVVALATAVILPARTSSAEQRPATPSLAATTRTVSVSSRSTSQIGAELAELQGSPVMHGAYFGYSVAISGGIAIVGAPTCGSSGCAFVFTKRTSGWVQTAQLTGSDTVAGDEFGSAVAISGTTVVVGAYLHAKAAGDAYVFTKTATGWKQVAELKGFDTVPGDKFGGEGIAISGANIVVGVGFHAGYSGRAYVFTRSHGTWKQTAELKGSDTIAGNEFGTSVAISGGIALIGAPLRDRFFGGVYVFIETASRWRQTAELKSSATTAGEFGIDVSVSGTTAVVGSSAQANGAGRAYVFTKTATGWRRIAVLQGSDSVAYDYFGSTLAISGTTAVVGSAFYDHDAGRAYVFTKTVTGWRQAAELEGSDTRVGDVFGSALAISGTTAVVGAYGSHEDAGRAYVFSV